MIKKISSFTALGLTLFLFGLLSISQAQDTTEVKSNIPFLQEKSAWADSVFQILDPDERIAQLIMIPVYSNRDQVHEDSISNLIKKYKVGGLIFFQGGPVRQARMTNRFQR